MWVHAFNICSSIPHTTNISVCVYMCASACIGICVCMQCVWVHVYVCVSMCLWVYVWEYAHVHIQAPRRGRQEGYSYFQSSRPTWRIPANQGYIVRSNFNWEADSLGWVVLGTITKASPNDRWLRMLFTFHQVYCPVCTLQNPMGLIEKDSEPWLVTLCLIVFLAKYFW